MGISFSCIAAVRNCAIRSSLPFQISTAGCVSVATTSGGSPAVTSSCAGISTSAGSSSSNFSSTSFASARSVESTATSNPNRGFQSIGSGSAVGATSSSPRLLLENGMSAACSSSSNAACTAGSSPAHSKTKEPCGTGLDDMPSSCTSQSSAGACRHRRNFSNELRPTEQLAATEMLAKSTTSLDSSAFCSASVAGQLIRLSNSFRRRALNYFSHNFSRPQFVLRRHEYRDFSGSPLKTRMDLIFLQRHLDDLSGI